MSHLWHKEWGVVKWRKWKKTCRSGQMVQKHLVRSIKFSFILAALHAYCMHACQDWVSQNWIANDESVHDAHTTRVFCNYLLTGLHVHLFFSVKSRMCATCEDCEFCMQYKCQSDIWPIRQAVLWRLRSRNVHSRFSFHFLECQGNANPVFDNFLA